jgi:nicotinamidase-related amidase
MHTALLLVDAQVNMFEPAAGLHDRDGVLERLRVLLAEVAPAAAVWF